MASIVVVTRFCESDGKPFGEYINYIDRDNATKRDALEKYNLFGEYIGYMENEEKTVQGHYKDGTEKVSSLFTRNSDNLSAQERTEMKQLFMKAQENGSNMWQTVISFENSYLAASGIYDPETGYLNEKVLMAAGRKAICAMLDKEGLQNAVWTASFHYNTDNIHIHVATVEPTPMREKCYFREWEKNENGRIRMKVDPATGRKERIPKLDINGNQIVSERYKGRFKGESIKALKSVLSAELEQDKESTIEITNMLRGIVNDKKEQQLLNDPAFRNELLEIYRELKKSGTERRYWNYNQKNFAEIRPKIDDLSDLFIRTYHRDDFARMTALMDENEANYASIYGGSNDYKKNKLYDRKEGLYTRLGNAILKELQNYDRYLEKAETGGSFHKPDIKKYSRTGQLLRSRREFERGLKRLQRDMQYNYSKWQNQAEHENLEREIESRGEIQPE